VTGNAIINSQGQGDNSVRWTRDEISQPSRPFSPRAATGHRHFLQYTTFTSKISQVGTWGRQTCLVTPLTFTRLLPLQLRFERIQCI